MSIEVLKPGLLSSFQDLGRTGAQAIGMPVCGAMDTLAHSIANLLVGNPVEQATLEITLLGPTLRFKRDCVIALAGADLSATLLDIPVPHLQAVRIPAGAVLQFGKCHAGVRAYLALAGGYGLAAVMGSRSTYLRGQLGGWSGRALRKGDVLPLPDTAPRSVPVANGAKNSTAGALLHGLLARGAGATIRFVQGSEWAQFTEVSQTTFQTHEYRISALSDRMGYRLEGSLLQRSAPREMLSEAVAFGTVQVPPNGLPIVLMADRQTTGGYARIAQVASVDLPLLAQRMPGDAVRFERISLETAQQVLQRRAAALASLRRALITPNPNPTPS